MTREVGLVFGSIIVDLDLGDVAKLVSDQHVPVLGLCLCSMAAEDDIGCFLDDFVEVNALVVGCTLQLGIVFGLDERRKRLVVEDSLLLLDREHRDLSLHGGSHYLLVVWHEVAVQKAVLVLLVLEDGASGVPEVPEVDDCISSYGGQAGSIVVKHCSVAEMGMAFQGLCALA